jgi:mono/diheme cytochrome c family protein
MVAAASFVIGFLLIGFSVVLVAMRGGPRGAREGMHTQTARGRSVATWAIAGVCLLFGIAIPTAVGIANGDHDRKAHGGVELTQAQAEGRREFTYNCGTCHTLKAANTAGRVGPNLDQLRPPKALVLDAIAKGRARGDGQMPSELLTGEDAEKVASFIEAVAGR